MANKLRLDWNEVARRFQDDNESVKVLSEDFGVSSSTIYRKARLQNWVRKNLVSPKENLVSPKEIDAVEEPVSKLDAELRNLGALKSEPSVFAGKFLPLSQRKALINRLYRALEQKIGFVEARLEVEENPSAAESEKDARTLTALVRLFEKLSELENQVLNERCQDAMTAETAIDSSKVQDSDRGEPDAERLRATLAAKLERLNKKL